MASQLSDRNTRALKKVRQLSEITELIQQTQEKFQPQIPLPRQKNLSVTQSLPAVPMVSLGLDILKVHAKNEELNKQQPQQRFPVSPVSATRNSCMSEHKHASLSPPFLPGSNTLKMLDDRDFGKSSLGKTALTPFEKS